MFDHNSPHNVSKLIQLGQNNLQIFSKDALSKRKQGNDTARPEWLDAYLSSAYVPTIDDFRHLRRHVLKWRRIYEANYKEIRDKWFAHKEVAGDVGARVLWGQSQGTNRELQRMFAFLNSLHDALWELHVNGRKPVLRKRRYSVAQMIKLPSPVHRGGPVQEQITREVESFLTSISTVCASETPRQG